MEDYAIKPYGVEFETLEKAVEGIARVMKEFAKATITVNEKLDINELTYYLQQQSDIKIQ
jgi:hypothetical protein